MNDHAANHGPSRREFHAAVALLASTPLATLAADEKPVDPLVATADALAAAARARYGKFLAPEQLAEVEKSIRNGVIRAELMKKVTLTNADEPAFAFSADVP